MRDIIENATIVFNNGKKENCNAISITNKGVYIGEISSNNHKENHMINHSFIPKDQIQRIFICNEKNGTKDLHF